LLGPSGAGKTLTLRLLAGLSSPDGDCHVAEGTRELHDLPAEQRGMAYVPQRPALLPKRTVWRQVTFGVNAKPALAAWWLDRLGLAGLESRYPHELSGGQQQRVSLVRALAIQPRVLLLDEPFSGLDAPVRDRLRRELRRLQHDTNLSTVIVTHDPEEAALLADEIIVLGGGRVLQSGTRDSVFHMPSSPEVAGLLGILNTNRGSVLAPGLLSTGGAWIHAPTGRLPAGQAVMWSVRPERITLDSAGPYRATLVDDIDLGTVRELTISLEGTLELVLRTDVRTSLSLGQELTVDVRANDVSVWPERPTPPRSGAGVEALRP
jgi:ABC-type Fe3+/spermidine/putrescine transport system ATPase subunit